MATLLNAIVEERRRRALSYEQFSKRVGELVKDFKRGHGADGYPQPIATPRLRAFYDNLGQDEQRAMAVEEAFTASAQDGWNSGNAKKERIVANAIRRATDDSGGLAEAEVNGLVAEAMQLAANHADD